MSFIMNEVFEALVLGGIVTLGASGAVVVIVVVVIEVDACVAATMAGAWTSTVP